MCMLCSSAFAKDTLKIVLPQPPGGLNDTFARFVQKQIMENADLNLNVVVANKPGGDGIVAMREVLNDKSEYVLFLSGTAFILKSMENEENRLAANSIIPVMHTMTAPYVYFVDKSSKIKNWNELVQYSKTNNVNMGLTSYLGDYALEEIYPKNTITKVLFGGDAPTLLNVRNKTVDVGVTTYFTAKPHIDSGDLVPLALTHENNNGIEYKHSDYGNAILGFYAPPSMTSEKIKRMHTILSEIVKSKQVKELFDGKGIFLSKNLSQESFIKQVDKVRRTPPPTAK